MPLPLFRYFESQPLAFSSPGPWIPNLQFFSPPETQESKPLPLLPSGPRRHQVSLPYLPGDFRQPEEFPLLPTCLGLPGCQPPSGGAPGLRFPHRALFHGPGSSGVSVSRGQLGVYCLRKGWGLGRVLPGHQVARRK